MRYVRQFERRAILSGIGALCLARGTSSSGQTRRSLRWSHADQLEYATFVPTFAAAYSTPVDCADLALDSLITFAARNQLPVRLFDFDGPGHSKRWLEYDPRVDDWHTVRAFLMDQLGAINVIENSRKITLPEVRAGDLIMHENIYGGDFTGHTRVLLSATYDADRQDYFIRRYEGTLPPVVPVLKESWFNEIHDVYQRAPRRWNFGQFGMG